MSAALRGRTLLLAAALLLPAGPGDSAEPFAWRGYYFILSRNPSYGLEDYRLILDRMAEDRANLLILWIGGGFPSRRYPETWDHNREHRNCREDFTGKVIEHAHRRGIRVLLGLTPFAYDGVNRWGLAHPEHGAVDAAGKPAVTGGIHSLGRGLCPSKAAAREFMMGYCRELFEEFYPQADGLFLEHSDYGACACPACAGGEGLRREWELVQALSARVWERKPGALMLVYPQYAKLGVEYDPRHLIFIAPHNRDGAERVRNPRVLSKGYWDVGGFFADLARTAAGEGYAGFVPSMENFTYENPHAFDTRWGPAGSAGWDDLLVRVTRLSFREYTARPGLGDAEFRELLRAAFFEEPAPEGAARDLLDLHRLLNRWEGWTWRGGVMRTPAGTVDPAALDPPARAAFEREKMAPLREVKAIGERAREAAGKAPGPRSRETLERMAAIALWVERSWSGKVR